MSKTTADKEQTLAGMLSGSGEHRKLERARDLIAWLNVHEDYLDDEDMERLAALSNNNQFDAWDCPTCDDRVRRGDPDSWDHFQGADNPDYASYPGGSEQQCDYCRCHHPDEDADEEASDA